MEARTEKEVEKGGQCCQGGVAASGLWGCRRVRVGDGWGEREGGCCLALLMTEKGPNRGSHRPQASWKKG